jgi:predicted enzyme related to lactoylglutathione lyase
MTSDLQALTFDCADAARVAAFWAEVLGRTVNEGAGEEFASLGEPGPSWYFVKVPEAKTTKNRMHPDLAAEDLDAEVQRLIGLGASQLATYDEGGNRWTTLADPEGNEFDVVAAS